MTELEIQAVIKDIEVGSKLQVIKTNGDILDVILASHDTAAVEEKQYEKLVVPAMPPALIVHGGRWGSYRINAEDIVKIAKVGERR